MNRTLSLCLSHQQSRFAATLLGAAILFALYLPSHGAEHKAAEHHHESVAPTGVCSLDVYANDGHLHLLTSEGEGKEIVLLYRHSEDGGSTWSGPVRVDAGMPPLFSPHRGMDPQLAAVGNRLIAVWTTNGTDQWGSGPMVTSLSNDGGKTWTTGPNPADDKSTVGHGFMDIAADRSGAFHLAWLDNRDGKQGLRYTRSQDGGKSWEPNATVKAGTCECCPNAIAAANGEVAILFRDNNPRDMKVVRSLDNGSTWLPPIAAGVFNWEFNGCPHQGGGLVISGTKGAPILHTVVWTGIASGPGVYYTAVSDSAQNSPIRLGGETAAHPDLGMDGRDVLTAAWDETIDGVASIFSSTSPDAGKTWSKPVRVSSGKVNATHPKVTAASVGSRIFWTEGKPGSPSTWASSPLP